MHILNGNPHLSWLIAEFKEKQFPGSQQSSSGGEERDSSALPNDFPQLKQQIDDRRGQGRFSGKTLIGRFAATTYESPASFPRSPSATVFHSLNPFFLQLVELRSLRSFVPSSSVVVSLNHNVNKVLCATVPLHPAGWLTSFYSLLNLASSHSVRPSVRPPSESRPPSLILSLPVSLFVPQA